MIAWNKKNTDVSVPAAVDQSGQPANVDKDEIISMVTKAVNTITQRLNSLSTFDGVDSKVSTLVLAANSHDNLCRMDPAWHPWL